MARQIRPVKEESWGIDFEFSAHKAPEETPVTDAGWDRDQMEAYGRLHRKKGFLARLVQQKKRFRQRPDRGTKSWDALLKKICIPSIIKLHDE